MEGMDPMDYGMEGEFVDGMEGYMDEDGNMMEMEDGEMMEEDMDEMADMGEGDEGFQDPDDESLNFDDNPEYAHMTPLDRMRKIRRAIVKTINDLREGSGAAPIYIDPNANKAANDYAQFLLENELEQQDKLTEICKNN